MQLVDRPPMRCLKWQVNMQLVYRAGEMPQVKEQVKTWRGRIPTQWDPTFTYTHIYIFTLTDMGTHDKKISCMCTQSDII